jgi:hypothetical protein
MLIVLRIFPQGLFQGLVRSHYAILAFDKALHVASVLVGYWLNV